MIQDAGLNSRIGGSINAQHRNNSRNEVGSYTTS